MNINQAMKAIQRLGYDLCGAEVKTESSNGVPTNTYLDEDMTTLAPNPIVLDTNGNTPRIYTNSALMLEVTAQGALLRIGSVS